jgi:hypothetical protein
VCNTTYNFGEVLPGSIGGYVYSDTNNNGLKETGETGIGCVKVTLTGTTDLGPIAPITVTTACDGSYKFSNLRPGTYTITETQPTCYLDGQDAKEGVVIPGSGATDVISGLVLNSGNASANNTFGELKAGKLSGCVYQDLDNDGIKECGESGVSGVLVTLTGANDLGAITPITTKTSCDGSYSFTGLRPGTYTITETPPAGYFDGKETVGSLGGTIGTDTFTQIFVPSNDQRNDLPRCHGQRGFRG